MFRSKRLKVYLIGLVIVVIISFLIGIPFLNTYPVSCPYGGEFGPNGEPINFRHICPDGPDWSFVALFVILSSIAYTIFIGLLTQYSGLLGKQHLIKQVLLR